MWKFQLRKASQIDDKRISREEMKCLLTPSATNYLHAHRWFEANWPLEKGPFPEIPGYAKSAIESSENEENSKNQSQIILNDEVSNMSTSNISSLSEMETPSRSIPIFLPHINSQKLKMSQKITNRLEADNNFTPSIISSAQNEDSIDLLIPDEKGTQHIIKVNCAYSTEQLINGTFYVVKKKFNCGQTEPTKNEIYSEIEKTMDHQVQHIQ
ncbi:hypothetical protein SNEBB_007743 [Seison nebaliae]|nr:hypothetical protein SNEBB_007743 [Seison nebaliae]